MLKLAKILFLIRVFTPLVNTLSTDGTVDVQNLPEYREHLQRMGYPPKRNKTVPSIPTPIMSAPQPFGSLPPIQLCKETPGDIYGHIFCWGMICLYALLIISLIIYQLRSILWVKLNILQNNVQQPDNSNFEIKSKDEQNLRGVLPL